MDCLLSSTSRSDCLKKCFRAWASRGALSRVAQRLIRLQNGRPDRDNCASRLSSCFRAWASLVVERNRRLEAGQFVALQNARFDDQKLVLLQRFCFQSWASVRVEQRHHLESNDKTLAHRDTTCTAVQSALEHGLVRQVQLLKAQCFGVWVRLALGAKGEKQALALGREAGELMAIVANAMLNCPVTRGMQLWRVRACWLSWAAASREVAHASRPAKPGESEFNNCNYEPLPSLPRQQPPQRPGLPKMAASSALETRGAPSLSLESRHRQVQALADQLESQMELLLSRSTRQAHMQLLLMRILKAWSEQSISNRRSGNVEPARAYADIAGHARAMGKAGFAPDRSDVHTSLPESEKFFSGGRSIPSHPSDSTELSPVSATHPDLGSSCDLPAESCNGVIGLPSYLRQAQRNGPMDLLEKLHSTGATSLQQISPDTTSLFPQSEEDWSALVASRRAQGRLGHGAGQLDRHGRHAFDASGLLDRHVSHGVGGHRAEVETPEWLSLASDASMSEARYQELLGYHRQRRALERQQQQQQQRRQ